MLDKDLYERYLQKKAKKLGISVEELRNQNQSSNQQTSQEVQSHVVIEPTPILEPQVNNNIVIEDKRENKFALIGYPLGHSLSEVIHKSGFKSIGLDAKYDILETLPEDIVERVKMLKNSNYRGFNVTIPLKLPIALFVDEIDASADIAGAINTVIVNPDRTLKGYNTDVVGFKNAIPKDFNLQGKVAGILGTGGASRAATVAIAQGGVKEVRFYTRNIPNALGLLNYMRKVYPNIVFNVFQIENIRDLSMIDILINATPIGMQGYSADMTPVEKWQLSTLPKSALVYDVIYNPRKTILVKLAEELGYRTVNGIEMLLGQAVAAEEIWTGQIPNVTDMKIALLEAL